MRVGMGGEADGDLGRQAERGLVESPTVLAGHFPPPFRTQHMAPQEDGGGEGLTA